MRVSIATPAPYNIYESNLPTFDDKETNSPTRIRFDHQVTSIYPDDTTKTKPVNETNPDSRVTTESVPISGIHAKPNIDTISALSSNAFNDHNKANNTIEFDTKN